MYVQRTFSAAIFLCLSMGFPSPAQANVCDVDKNGVVDRQDLSLIVSARNTPAVGPDDPRDADGNGTITVLDVRTCIRQCNVDGCAIVDPRPAAATDEARKADAPEATSKQKAVNAVKKSGETTTDQLSTDVQRSTMVSGTKWKVSRGDTLYAIGRAIYPGDSRKQALLRRDIMKLNPSVFANGANNMAVGTILNLPDYVAPKSARPVASKPVPVPVPVPDTVTTGSAPQPTASAPVVKQEAESQAKREVSAADEQLDSFPLVTEGNFLLSLGYSYGGDKLVNKDGSYDPGGAGGHLRLGYEKMYQQYGGYRIALGLQYGLGDDGGDTSVRDTYLQLAYQYRSNPVIFGIGVLLSEGMTLENDSTTDYDAALGGVVYLENVGSGVLAGWGLSYTALEIDEEDGSESFDVSRAELYYNWKF